MKKNKYWFRPKAYGYGVYPISWQGVLATLGLVVLLLASAYTNNILTGNIFHWKFTLRFLLDIFILATIFLIIMEPKIEGKLKWRWGNKQ